jgi:hypothetical protein
VAADLQPIFDALVPILRPVAKHLNFSLEHSVDNADHYSVWEDAPGKATMFGVVIKKKTKVSFYLHPLSLFKDLRLSIGKPLLKLFRPRGSFFDFEKIDPPAMAALGDIVEVALERWLLERTR